MAVRWLKILNQKPKIAFLSRSQMFTLLATLVLANFITLIMGFSGLGFLFMWVGFSVGAFILLGNKPHEFADRLDKPPGEGEEWINANLKWVNPANKKAWRDSQKPVGRVKYVQGFKGIPLDNYSDLHAVHEIGIGGDQFTVWLYCQKGTIDRWYAQIPLKLSGIHPETPQEEVKARLAKISAAGGDFPRGQRLKIVQGCRSHCRERVETLEEQAQLADCELISCLNHNEASNTKRLTANRVRQQWYSYVVLEWEKNNFGQKGDWWGLLAHLWSQWLTWLWGEQRDLEKKLYSHLAREIHRDCYRVWGSYLGRRWNLGIEPLSWSQAWEYLWYSLNDINSSPEPIPVLVQTKQRGRRLSSQIYIRDANNPRSLLSVLLSQNPLRARNGYAAIRMRGKWAGAVVLDRPRLDEYEPEEQFTWLWKILGALGDAEVSVQIEGKSKAETIFNLIQIGKQEKNFQQLSEWMGDDYNISSTSNQQESYRVREQLNAGEEVFWGSVVIWLFRDSLEELNKDQERLCARSEGGKLIPEPSTCFRLFLECSMLNNWVQMGGVKQIKGQRTVVSDRRITFDSRTLTGILPLCKPQDIHESGVEFLYAGGSSEPCGYSLYLDNITRPLHMLVVAPTDSGKGTLVAKFITNCLSREVRLVGMDLSEEGKSSFALYGKLLGDRGAVVNLLENCFNILGQPNYVQEIAGDLQERDRRQLLWQSQLQTVIMAIVVGKLDESFLIQRIEALIIRLLSIFLADSEIRSRYQQGSPPTLEALLPFCTQEKLQWSDWDEEDEKARRHIVHRLKTKLADPSIGKALSSPSNIPKGLKFLIFAFNNLGSDENAQIMSLVAHMACVNFTLSSKDVFILIDEFTRLGKNPYFRKLAQYYLTTGRKEGVSSCVISQTWKAIGSDPDMAENFEYCFVGRVNANAVRNYAQSFRIPETALEQLTQNSSSTQFDRSNLARSWLLLHQRTQSWWHVKSCSAPLELGILATNPSEKEQRESILGQPEYTGSITNQLRGIKQFSHECFLSQK